MSDSQTWILIIILLCIAANEREDMKKMAMYQKSHDWQKRWDKPLFSGKRCTGCDKHLLRWCSYRNGLMKTCSELYLAMELLFLTYCTAKCQTELLAGQKCQSLDCGAVCTLYLLFWRCCKPMFISAGRIKYVFYTVSSWVIKSGGYVSNLKLFYLWWDNEWLHYLLKNGLISACMIQSELFSNMYFCKHFHFTWFLWLCVSSGIDYF